MPPIANIAFDLIELILFCVTVGVLVFGAVFVLLAFISGSSTTASERED